MGYRESVFVMKLQCDICHSRIIYPEIQSHIIACELRTCGYRPQVANHYSLATWKWLVDVFSPTAFLLGVRKEGEDLYTISYSPSDYPIQFDNLNEAVGHMWRRLNQYEQQS